MVSILNCIFNHVFLALGAPYNDVHLKWQTLKWFPSPMVNLVHVSLSNGEP